ncbi:MAG: S24 family peptidase [Bacilli bacterium]
MKTTAERILEGLSLRNMKQSDLVEKTGIGKSSISTYIKGTYEPKQRNIYKIAKALNVNESWLMGYDVPIGRDSLEKVSDTSKGILIPVLGEIVAGIPLDAIEEILDYEEISPELANRGEYIALQVKGNSMEPRFVAGDVVIIRSQPDCETGDIVAVLINGDASTLKKIKKHDDGSLSLIPLNAAYDPLFFSKQEVADIPVSIIGKVVELRAKF